MRSSGVVARRSRRAAVLLVVAATPTLLVVAPLLAVVAAARDLESFSAVAPLAIYAMIVWSLGPLDPSRIATTVSAAVATETAR